MKNDYWQLFRKSANNLIFLKKNIIESKLKINHLLERYKHQDVFTTKDIRNFYSLFEGAIPNSTINWRIYQLIKSGIISRIGKGKYKVGKADIFKPILNEKEISIGKYIEKHFPFIDYCLWNSAIVKEFSLHQSFNRFIIVETERDTLDAVFHHLKEKYKYVYFKPTKDIVENYLLDIENVIIVQHLVSEAPLQKIHNTPTITIEKLLVDLVYGKSLFYFYQGYELKNIFQQAFDKHTINKSALLRYADRRKRKDEINKILKTINRH